VETSLIGWLDGKLTLPHGFSMLDTSSNFTVTVASHV
jgi:hypothetical protein